MKKPLHIAIIGGGAAGMMAAITAIRRGAAVTVFERQDRIGKKIPATGNGRCNLTNIRCSADNYHGAQAGFPAAVLDQFPVKKTLEFFNSLGVCIKVEEDGRIFPLTGQASTILDVLRYEIERLGVSVHLKTGIQSISQKKGFFILQGTEREERADRVIVTTGGRAMPQLGGSDTGIDLLSRLGHKALPVFPVLVPLKTNLRFSRQLKGVKIIARGHLEIAGKPAGKQEGEFLFTDYGLSGPPIIQFSVSVNYALQKHLRTAILLDLFPEWTEDRLLEHLFERFSARPEAFLEHALIGLIHKRLIPVILQEAGIGAIRKKAGLVLKEEAACIVRLLKNWKFEITGSLSWNEAHVMAGGISTSDFYAETLESRLVKGLYAAGEILDVTGDCGGYNLQWAWSSGYVAGLHAAKDSVCFVSMK